MARNLYGCTSADFTLTESGRVVAGATATVWTARTGGTQITDLTDLDGDAITSVTSDADGGIRFYGVDGDKDAYWLDTGTGARIAVRPVDLTGETGPTPDLSIGTVTTGTAAATITGTAEDPVLNLTLPSAGANGVNTAAIQNDAVTSDKIAANAVGTSELADAAVTSAKLDAEILRAAGLDVVLDTAASPQTLTSPTVQQLFAANAISGLLQPSAAKAGASFINTSVDEVAPVQLTVGGVYFYQAGNHKILYWRIAKGSLSASDVGKVWAAASGTYDRITLMAVDGTYAYFSVAHNAALTGGTNTAPSGTWTLAANPDVTFSSPTAVYEQLANRNTVDEVSWTSGRSRLFHRRLVQELVAWNTIVAAQQASVGTPVSLTGLTTLATLTTDWRWPGDQPGVTIVDVSLTAGAANLTVNQWGGLQMEAALSGTIAVLGTTSTLATWRAAGAGSVNVDSGQWADATPPAVCLSRNSVGGSAIGLLAASTARASLTYPVIVSSLGKQYVNAMGAGVSTLTAGATATVRGWRSLTHDTSDRQVHIITDPVAGVTRWYLMAGSTGAATHPAAPRLVGRRLTKTRGTATVGGAIGSSGVTVTGAGWAEGTVDW